MTPVHPFHVPPYRSEDDWFYRGIFGLLGAFGLLTFVSFFY